MAFAVRLFSHFRGLEFTAKALRRSVDHPSEELSASFTQAYEETLRKHHSMLVRPLFSVREAYLYTSLP